MGSLGTDRPARQNAIDTVIVSDMHLADDEPLNPRRPLWKAFKSRRFFFDDDFARLLEHASAHATGPVELVLNGDIFDFDMITQLPAKPPGPVSWLSRLRGLPSEEWMSLFKLERIIDDHPKWFSALACFVADGHRAIFVTGNHDVELNWPSVKARIRKELGVDAESDRVVFCGSFYISGGDTMITHGHLFDPYCSEKHPIDPMISVHGRPRVRIPFGDMANRYMLNGMGYFNPHASDNYIMSLGEYATFFFKYMVVTQPLLLWTWFWSALITLLVVMRDFWRPAMRDPLLVDEKVQAIAARAQATPSIVRALEALTVPPACTDPFKIVKELWLDRGFLLILIVYGAWQVVLTINWVAPISGWWIVLAFALLFPVFLMYSFKIRSAVFAAPLVDEKQAKLIEQITGVNQMVVGHTHVPEKIEIGPLTLINGGFWSPAFAEPTCDTRIGTQSYTWLPTRDDGSPRQGHLMEWPLGASAPKYHAGDGAPEHTASGLAPESQSEQVS